MFTTERIVFLWLFAGLTAGCSSAAVQVTRPADTPYYKNPYVRQCMDLERARQWSASDGCWQTLKKKLESDPNFRKKGEFGEAEVARIAAMARRSEQRAKDLEKKTAACIRKPGSADERIVCLQELLRDKDRLSQTQRYEVESAISTIQDNARIRRGDQESTFEHAGKLLGALLYEESEGIRVEGVQGGPLQQAGVREQGLIIALDEIPLAELGSADRIARLESCRKQPIVVLVRYGGVQQATFQRVRALCGQPAEGKLLAEYSTPSEICSATGFTPEIRLGMLLCYEVLSGQLSVRWVCARSPAERAGVTVGHLYEKINGKPLLGMTFAEIQGELARYPEARLSFQAAGGKVLSLPALDQCLSEAQAKKCWVEASEGSPE